MIKTRTAILLLLTLLIGCLSASAQSTTPESYRIRYNDVIETSVFGNPDLGKQAVVPPDGVVSFPLIGETSVIDLTPRELERKLGKLYAEYLVNPIVSVSMNIFESTKVYIIGEVYNPGPLPYDSTHTLADYLILTGGITPDANPKKCLIIRAGAPDMQQEINLKQFIKEGTRPEIPLYPDDTVYIPRRSRYMISGWAEWSQFLNIILGATTLYLILSRENL